MSRLIGKVRSSARSPNLLDITVDRFGDDGWIVKLGSINYVAADLGKVCHRSEDTAIEAARTYVRKQNGELLELEF